MGKRESGLKGGGARARKRALARARASARKPRVGGWSSGAPWELRGFLGGIAGAAPEAKKIERGVALAIGRGAFRPSRAFRALSDLARALGENLIGEPGVRALKEICVFALSRPTYDYYPKDRLDPWRARIQRQGRARPRGRGRSERGGPPSAEGELLSVARKLGFPVRGQDERGEGLERWALDRLAGGGDLGSARRRRAVLRWWRDQGFEPDRPAMGARDLTEAAVAMGSVWALSEIESLWPDERSSRASGEALGRALELIGARDEAMRRPIQIVILPSGGALIAGASGRPKGLAMAMLSAARSAGRELLRRPEAVRSEGGLARFLLDRGDRDLGEALLRLETLALAREEREALDQVASGAGRGAHRARSGL